MENEGDKRSSDGGLGLVRTTASLGEALVASMDSLVKGVELGGTRREPSKCTRVLFSPTTMDGVVTEQEEFNTAGK